MPRAKRPSSSDDKPRDYEVGKGKPPKHTQFVKGQSGNPHGRRRKTPTLADLVEKEAETVIPGTELTKQAALVKRAFNEALTGKAALLKLTFEMIREAEGVREAARQAELQGETSFSPSDEALLKLLDQYEADLLKPKKTRKRAK